MGEEDARALAELLEELKRRSGYSYERIGVKTHLSRSTVHRYCRGSSLPAAFAPLERIATVCGADRGELSKLYRLWERADVARGNAATSAPFPPEPAPAPEPVPGPAPVPAAPARKRRWALLAATLALVTLVGASALPTVNAEPPPSRHIVAPMWTVRPQPVARELFGVTVNSATGMMPAFGVGSVRLWDSRTRWQNIEPARERFDWSTLDGLVEGARKAGFPVLFVFGGTPRWASPSAPPTAYPDGSRAAPPDDLADWDRFVGKVVERYRGRIEAYELWDMANHPKFFTGPVERLVEMTRRASRIIRAADPEATVVCPSMGQLVEPASRRVLERFGELGGYESCDAAAVKLHARRAADPPETMLATVDELEQIFHRTGGHANLWSTGTDFETPYQPPVDPDIAADHAARFYLTGLYARYQRMYFYSWGSARVPIVLQPAGGPPTKAAAYVERLGQWLAGARISSCRKGAQAGLPENLWQCDFERDGERFRICWTHEGTARLPVPAPAERLDGTRVETGEITGTPALLRTPSS
ncbi:helix-turn-helix domain-containing protein [Amycolatopsis sp.]|uniref:helix-turn-helix domain-containing protein n=1 Tax=Amycolatopsis sp. TaxID=37632 RepID=UPI002D7E7225|nr:helix-turn-helix domain-containing protein [Amycolatopsis sp.]HET6703965.1 helix-turn-helix domain-containing protein [Amycolatopsis sp.]